MNNPVLRIKSIILLVYTIILIGNTFGQQPSPSLVVKSYNPYFPPDLNLSSEELDNLRSKAFSGDGPAAFKLSNFYGLAYQDTDMQKYWLRMGVRTGSASCAHNFTIAFSTPIDTKNHQELEDGNLLKWAWRVYNRKWTSVQREEIKLAYKGLIDFDALETSSTKSKTSVDRKTK